MFVLSKQDNALFRTIATFVTVALVLYAVGTAYMRTAEAANITDVYDLISTSATSTAANHTIQFVSPNGVADGTTIVLDFGVDTAEFDLSTIADGDIDILENGTNVPQVGGWTSGVAGDVLTITFGGDSIAAGATTTILIGLHATNNGGTPSNQIVNPTTPGSYRLGIGAGTEDNGYTHIVIVDQVYITAVVDTVFDFTVIGHAATTTVNGVTETATSTATSIPFGTLSAGVPVVIAQDLTVKTNAINGFVVTAEVDHQMESSTGADIDGFTDSTYVDTPTAWVAPGGGTPNIANENTWGHWGITTEDNDTADSLQSGDEFGANEWIAATTSPRVVFAHSGPADEVTPNIGSTTIGFQVEVTALQEAADDYQAILTYIATPTF